MALVQSKGEGVFVVLSALLVAWTARRGVRADDPYKACQYAAQAGYITTGTVRSLHQHRQSGGGADD